MLGNGSFTQFREMYCLPVQDNDGKILKGRYTIDPSKKPSDTMMYGSRIGKKLNNTWPSGKEFSLSLLCDTKP